MISHDDARALIRAHFELASAPDKERAMRLHLADCAECSRWYERHLLVASLDPRAPSAERRLAAGLGFRPPRKLFARPLQFGFALAAVAAALFLAKKPDDFAARGSQPGARMAEVFVYRVAPTRASEAVGQSIRAADELAFAYVNAAGFSRLMVFAEDEHGHVYWYHPAWSDAAENPRAVAIQQSADLRELPESVAHDLDGKALKIHALFSHDELSVHDVERMLAEQRAGDRPIAARLGGARDVVVSLRVE